jgi:hypothetical protein
MSPKIIIVIKYYFVFSEDVKKYNLHESIIPLNMPFTSFSIS